MVTLTDDKSDATYPNNPSQSDNHDDAGLPPDYSEATSSTQSAHPEMPPGFAEPSGSSSTSPFAVDFTPLAPPTNYLTIKRTNSSVRGTYSIDPTLPAPPGAVKSQDRDERDLNLRLYSKNGSVNAVVDVVRGADSKGPARLETSAKNGSVEVTVYDRRQNRFRLQVFTHNGSATINIPPTFVGSVYSKLQNGRLRFHSEVQKHVTTFSELENEGRYFIGDFSVHGYEDEETWHMDHLHIESQNGSVNVNFRTYGTENPKDGGKGFFSRLFSG